MNTRSTLALSSALSALVLTLASCGDGAEEEPLPEHENALTYGLLYPQTGGLAFFGPPQLAAAEYARHEINAAGGVLGENVPEFVEADETADEGQAYDAANDLVAQDVDAVIGAAASSMTQAVYSTITGAGIVQCSGSSTAPELTDTQDEGYLYRTAPSDLMAGPVLAQEIADGEQQDGEHQPGEHQDGEQQNVALVARADDYGSGYMEAVEEELRSTDIEVAVTEAYDPDTTNFGAIIESVDSEDVDAIALISFEEGAQILAALLESGFDGDQIYVTDGLNDPDLGATVNDDTDLVNGITGVAPGTNNPDFNEDLLEFAPELEAFQFTPQVYDCVTLVALAAESAGSIDPTDYAPHMAEVSRPEGTECTSFEECRDLLQDGQDIDYQGASSDIDFDDNGDPTTATFEIFHWDQDGYSTRDHVEYTEDEN